MTPYIRMGAILFSYKHEEITRVHRKSTPKSDYSPTIEVRFIVLYQLFLCNDLMKVLCKPIGVTYNN